MVAPDTDDTTNQEGNDAMPNDKTKKPTAGRAAGTKRGEESTSRGARRQSAASRSAFDFMKQKLSRDAAGVSERDIRALRTSVPEKLKTVDTKQLRKELEWVGELVGRVRTLWDMLFDKEFVIDWKSKALVGASLLYFVLPTDLTPDFIPGIGYIDDALVLATVWKLIQEKIDEYIDFKQRPSRRSARRADTGEESEAAAG
jgi:uncharacterized membrane protein YkvA (DUF1232 family)